MERVELIPSVVCIVGTVDAVPIVSIEGRRADNFKGCRPLIKLALSDTPLFGLIVPAALLDFALLGAFCTRAPGFWFERIESSPFPALANRKLWVGRLICFSTVGRTAEIYFWIIFRWAAVGMTDPVFCNAVKLGMLAADAFSIVFWSSLDEPAPCNNPTCCCCCVASLTSFKRSFGFAVPFITAKTVITEVRGAKIDRNSSRLLDLISVSMNFAFCGPTFLVFFFCCRTSHLSSSGKRSYLTKCSSK